MLVEAIIGHLVGDYVLQTDWMALKKKQSSWICAVHCTVWTTSVCLFGGLGWWAAAVLFVTHFIQDRTYLISWWMDLVGQASFKDGPCAPWSSIMVDNVFHIVTIWAVIKFLPA